MCTITYGNVETKYPINIINFSDGLKLKYWIIDGEYHIALWDGERCIVKDEDGTISFVLRYLVKVIHECLGANKINGEIKIMNKGKVVGSI